MNSTAVAIFSFNRPHYLEQVLRSLEKNEALHTYDFYLFQDGAVNKFSGRQVTSDHLVAKCIEVWNHSSLPNKELQLNPFNVSIGISWFEAANYLFDFKSYERVMFFEDDLVVNRFYLRTLGILLTQFEKEENVGVVMCYGCHPKKDNARSPLELRDKVTSGCDHFWGWACWKSRWTRIKRSFLDYYKFIAYCDDRDVPTQQILQFYSDRRFRTNNTAHDGAIFYSLFSNDMFILNTALNRARYIGAEGFHMTPTIYEKRGYAEMDFVDDADEGLLQSFSGYDKALFLERLRKFSISDQIKHHG